MIKAPDVTLLYVIVAFTIAYAILKKFLFVPLAAILEARATEEATSARVHAESLERLAAEVSRAEAELSRARVGALKEREALRAEGRAHLEKKLAQAHASATEVLARASQEIDSEAQRSTIELPGRVRQLANALAEKVLGRKLAA